jgi:hypothetical protein
MDRIMEESGISEPGFAAQARGALADKYDAEVQSRLELARFAHENGLKSTFQHLMKMVGQSRKIAGQAREREQLQQIMAARLAPQPGPVTAPMGAPGAMAAPGVQPAPVAAPADATGALPHYAGGTDLAGLHPGGAAVVGEQGPEVVDMPAGARVTPNLLTVIRMLLDVYEQGQAGGGAPAPPAPGPMPVDPTVQELDTEPVPHYAFGTGGSSGWGGMIQHLGTQLTGPPKDIGPNPMGFLDDKGNFKGTQGLQNIQLTNAAAGNYDPLGSQKIADLAKANVLGSMGARQAQAANTADIYGAGDPAFRAYARLKAQADTQSEAARAYGAAQLQQAQGGQAFGRDVYLNQLGAVTRRDPKEPNPLAQIAGSVIGAGVGALMPGAGGMAQVTPHPALDPGAGGVVEQQRVRDPNELAWQP